MPAAAPAPKRMGKFRASYLLATESFELFRQDKEIAWFVVWNAFWVFLIALFFAGSIFALAMTGIVVLPGDGETASVGMQVLGYLTLFVYYLVCSFITTYYGIALTAVVSRRLEGGDATYSDGVNAARERFGKIVKWSIVSSTVGVILSFLADRASWVARMFSFLGGVAWGVATFFIVPVLAREDESVPASVKRSSQVFVSTWGETIILNFSLSLFFTGIHITALIVVGIVLLVAVTGGGAVLAMIVLVLYLLFLVVMVIIHSVLEKVFRVVLYEYAVRGTIPSNFTPQLIMGALRRKDGAPITPSVVASAPLA